MNILYLTTWFPYPPDNGSKLRVYHLLRALGGRHEVTLLSFAFDTARPDDAANLQAICHSVHVVEQNPFEVNRSSTLATFLSSRPVVSRPVPAMSRLVEDALCNGTFDAIIASTEMTADYALMAAPGLVKILEEHNSMTRWMHERYEDAACPLQRARCWASWHKRRRYEAGYYRRFDLVTMVSDADRLTTLATVGEVVQVETIPNGVDCEHNRPGLAQPRPQALVYNGSLTYSANYDAMQWFLAEVYPAIRRAAPGVTLSITGSTRGVDTAGLALHQSVNLTGYVEDVRLPVAGATVCVVPIRQGGGTRLKILEAMALGTPVVATSKGAEGLDAVDGEHLLIADSASTFAEYTVALMEDTGLRRTLAANARRLVEERYDWRQIGEHFVDLVETTAVGMRKARA